MIIKSPMLEVVINGEGFTESLKYAPDGTELMKTGEAVPFAVARIDGKAVYPVRAECENDVMTIDFGGQHAVLVILQRPECLIIRVRVCSEGIEKLDFANFLIEKNNYIAVTGLALNINTDGHGLPGDSDRICAHGYKKLGINGCAMAVTAASRSELAGVLKEITKKYTQNIPWSFTGGAFAAENRAVRGSYVFNMDGMTERSVHDWIDLCRALGAEQIDFHGGHSFRFGDCEPNRTVFPEGRASFKRVIDTLHTAGIKAGLHTYAHFIDPASYLVTPVPDRGLDASHIFTLKNGINADETELFFNEDTADLHTVTGFFVRNSVLIAIDDEIIKFSAVKKDAPFGVYGCERGALGTKAAPHGAGAQARHLKSCFGLLTPAKDSELFSRVAELTAEMYNECGFDMMYMDALDGDDIFDGGEFAWHYGSKFVFEIMKRVKKPPVLEMSTMHHHLWYVRSRLGAWDCPTRAHKVFLEAHNQSNLAMKKASLLPQNIGWWVYGRTDERDISLATRMFCDDYEYMTRLSLANDWSLAYLRMSPDGYKKSAELRKIASLIKKYETLRLENSVPENIKEKIAEEECTLGEDGEFYRVKYISKTVNAGESVTIDNPYGVQRPYIRVENLARMNNASRGKLIFDPERDLGELRVITSKNVRAKIADENGMAVFRAEQLSGDAGYARIELKYGENGLDMTDLHVLNVEMVGDGGGEVLNLQLKSPKHLVSGFCDRLIDVDFEGEREITLIENDAARMGENLWPFSGGGHYTKGAGSKDFDIPNISGVYNEYEWNDSLKDAGIYHAAREKLALKSVHSLSIWINNMRPGVKYSVGIGKIMAFPAVKKKAENVCLSSGGNAFKISLVPALGYAESEASGNSCFINNGKASRAELSGFLELEKGKNTVEVTCKNPDTRLKLTFGFVGEKI